MSILIQLEPSRSMLKTPAGVLAKNIEDWGTPLLGGDQRKP